MRPSSTLAAILFLSVCASCTPQLEAAAPAAHPNLIVVRQFAFSPGGVALDPSLGFSLNRGAPGAPPRERAATVGRAAAFDVADTVTEQLRALGYDVLRSDSAAAEPGGKALVVKGTFRRIDEGRRHQNASVAVAVEIDYQAGGAAPQRLAAFDLDSRSVAALPIAAAEARRAGVNAAAYRVGTAIARYVGNLAAANRWPGAPR